MKRILLLLWIVPALGVAQKNTINGIDTILKRLTNIYLQGETHLPVMDSVNSLLATQNADGTWAAFNYTEHPKVDLPCIEHLSRLVKMAIAYRQMGSKYYRDTAVARTIHRGLQFWIDAKPSSGNWWYNSIGVPMEVGKVLVLMQKEITPSEKAAGIAILKRANVNGVLIAGSTRATGQNMIWVANLQLVAACLTASSDYLQFSIDNAASELKVSTGEGIQPDWSFHQHGPQLYSGGYGLGTAADGAQLAWLLHNTLFALNDTIIANLSHYILDGQQWLLRGNKIDYGTMGREISRVDKTAYRLVAACRNMMSLHTDRQAEFEAMADAIEKKQANISGGVSGNRFFPYSDFMVQQRPQYYASVKMTSNRMVGTESGNDEGLKNYHLVAGTTLLQRTGTEYENIFPLWDWEKLPGVTNRVRSGNETLPLLNFGSGAKGTTAFVGGVSDSLYGASAFDLNRDSVTGRKAWFFFEKEIVCLGAGLQVQMNAPLTTSINQCFARGEVHYKLNSREKTLGTKTIQSSLKWVHHDSVAYYFDNDSQVQVQQEKRHASWSVINRTVANPPEQSGTVFSLWLNHPDRVNSYAYTIVPAISLSNCRYYYPKQHWRILANTVTLQAVQQLDVGVVQVVFWEAGQVVAEGFGKIQVNKPCMLMLRKQGRKLVASVSEPTGDNTEVQVQIFTKEKVDSLLFHLPSGGQAGRTVSRVFGSF